MQRGRCQLCGTVSPSFVRLTRRAPEGGRRNPRRWDKYFFHVYIGLHRDVRPAGTVFSVAISPVRPSPPLRALQRASSPTLWRRTGTGHRHARYCASYSLSSTAPSRGRAPLGQHAMLETVAWCSTAQEVSWAAQLPHKRREEYLHAQTLLQE
jgi:hypothetical protein